MSMNADKCVLQPRLQRKDATTARDLSSLSTLYKLHFYIPTYLTYELPS